MGDYPTLKINQLYLLFNEWDVKHTDYFRVVELQTQPNGSFVLYCEEDREFFDLIKIEPSQLEIYETKVLAHV